MAKPSYRVEVVRKGRERDYFDFWRKGIARNGRGEALSADLVSFVEVVRASNRREAAVLARARHPGHQVDMKTVKKEPSAPGSRPRAFRAGNDAPKKGQATRPGLFASTGTGERTRTSTVSPQADFEYAEHRRISREISKLHD